MAEHAAARAERETNAAASGSRGRADPQTVASASQLRVEGMRLLFGPGGCESTTERKLGSQFSVPMGGSYSLFEAQKMVIQTIAGWIDMRHPAILDLFSGHPFRVNAAGQYRQDERFRSFMQDARPAVIQNDCNVSAASSHHQSPTFAHSPHSVLAYATQCHVTHPCRC